MLVSPFSRGLVFAGPSDTRFPGALPAGVLPIPDALGRFWSNWGELKAGGQLTQLYLPVGTQAIAKLRDGYLLTDAKRTTLLKWVERTQPVRVATGSARVLAVADDLVAFGADTGEVMHVLNLTTGRTIDVHPGGFATTARFSADRSRLALFVITRTGRQEMVLADAGSGRLITRIATSTTSAGLRQFRALAAGFQPVPFTWNAKTAELVVVAAGHGSPVIDFVNSADGKIARTAHTPKDLTQIEILNPPTR